MPQTDEERDLAVGVAQPKRADSAISRSSNYSVDMEKEETWPLNPEKSEQRPLRPWSEMKKGTGMHAL
jgi:hypothetical protein